jgi:ATP-dependent Clp protease adaptor protein ClpS
MSTATETLTKVKLKTPSMWKVLLHNDDYTPMDFVIAVLVQVFHKGEEEAHALALTVHNQGKANIGLYTKEVALTKVSQVERIAREEQHPLKVTAEEA